MSRHAARKYPHDYLTRTARTPRPSPRHRRLASSSAPITLIVLMTLIVVGLV